MDREYLIQEVFANQEIIHKICRMYRDSPEDREDLFQEIVLQLWKSLDQYRGSAKLTTWMYRVGLNTAMATFRKPKLDATRLPNADHLAIPGPTGEPGENEERLFAAIRQLRESDRALLALYLDALPYEEIGEELGISANNVGVRLSRIRASLRNILNE